MSVMASQIASLTIVYLTFYSGPNQRKPQSSTPLAFCAGNSRMTGDVPAQMASDAENVFIWWHHHEIFQLRILPIPAGVLGHNDASSSTDRILITFGICNVFVT